MRYVISNVSESNVKRIIKLMKEIKVKVLVFMSIKTIRFIIMY